MGRILKIAALVLGLAAVAVLAFFGFAIWVFIPLLPAIIVYVVAVASAKKGPALQKRESHSDEKKAA